MAIKNRKELFIAMLSNVREGAEKSAKIYQELAQAADETEIKQALEARAFVSRGMVSTLDEAFKMLGETPVKLTGHMKEVFLEDFKRELSEIQSPEARRLFVLMKAIHFNHARIGEYIALVAAADLSGHKGVGVLLESCLAEKLAFTERTRRFLRALLVNKLNERIAA